MIRIEYFEPRRASAVAGRVRALLDGDLTLAPTVYAPARESVLLPESGLAVFRSGAHRVVLDVGELGFGALAAHGHPDALSLLADADGTTLLRDSGTCAYAPPASRERHRATAAHNTVVIDGRNQAKALGPHLWGRRFTTTIEAHALAAELDYIRASHDGYRPVIHTRSVTFLKPELVLVLDRVTAPHECEATLVWQRPPEAPKLSLSVASTPPAAHTYGDGPFSPRYTWCMEAPRSTWSARGREVVFATVISFAGQRPALSADHQLGETVIEVAGRRLIERWRGGPAEVQG
jgi:heparinase II/III-like protein